MSLNPAQISQLIKAQIQNIDQDLEMNESGTVLSIGMVLQQYMVFAMQ